MPIYNVKLPESKVPYKRKASRVKHINQGKMIIEEPHQVIQKTHHELLLEIQYKYPGLYNLSRKTRHSLLGEIAQIIFQRLKEIMSKNLEPRSSCFKLSSMYRKLNPHFLDFQMIQDSLYQLQDANGAPRIQLTEQELLHQPSKPYTVDNIPFSLVKSACNKYTEQILNTISEHVMSLDSAVQEEVEYTEEVIARKKVREEIKNLMPFMPTIVKQVVSKHFMAQKPPMYRIRIYGEPFLPSKELISPFMHRYHAGASRVLRHPRMFNLLLFDIPQKQYAQLMAMDGTFVCGAKLVIRSDSPVYVASPELRTAMVAALGGPREEPLLIMTDEFDKSLAADLTM